ncbi:hypothetical protein GCM10007859_04310 [Brevundimonas denitrificans]|uniref:ATP-binding protein n=1 Tax=Brevundimonas denitrificans TaxID=1443434 RepID=A0ABQ6BH99_9CAUL|nr:hypothetical protein [Brevundimonas denitrificans]GLS00425.1 hypothetical protein GCM10007859_04310 [Brevundimonas denitrificans]
MNETPSAEIGPRAESLETLIAAWGENRRARGGWWALAGFSFQAAVYLQRFFEGLEQGNNPTELAKTELLSDVFFPKNGLAQLIQVKRTLTVTSLRSALREAYEIALLCEPSLLTRIRFRIACLNLQTTIRPRDLDPREVIGEDVKLEVWTAVVASFQWDDAIWQEQDPFVGLHEVLWRAGVTDSSGFIDACLSMLLRAFEHPSRFALEDLALALAREFTAQGRWRAALRTPTGIRLSASDVRLEPGAHEDTSIVFNRRPLLSDLKMNRFRERPRVFSEMVRDYGAWWKDLQQNDQSTKIPMFWVSGRSGEGKSVLLLQLAQHILTGTERRSVTVLRSPDDLPKWINEQRELQGGYTSPAAFPSVALVDDLPFVTDHDAWNAAIHQAANLVMPKVAILTCGPTIERETFESEFATVADVHSFDVPNLASEEMASFAEWYTNRTGHTALAVPAEAENRLLVIWLFELVQHEPIAAFAASFRGRLRRLGLFDLAKSILAANAIGLPASREILEDLADEQKDAFIALCSQSQLHFEISDRDGGGLALAHPQISWAMFREWVVPPTTVAKALGRALAPSLIAAARRQDTVQANSLLFNAGTTPILQDGDGGGAEEMLAELNAKVSSALPAGQRSPLLPRWMDIITKRPGLKLAPNPVDEAVQLTSTAAIPSSLAGYISGWLWRVSDLAEYASRSAELRQAAQNLLLGLEPSPGVDAALSMISRRGLDRPACWALCRLWLESATALGGSGRAIAPILAAWPQEKYAITRAMEWIEANIGNAQAYSVMVPLLASRRTDQRLKELAIEWVSTHRSANEPVSYYVLETLIAVRPSDRDVLNLALEWVKANPLHPWVRQLLQPLLAHWPNAQGLRDVSSAWVAHSGSNQAAHIIVGAMVSAYEDEKAIQLALTWCKQEADSDQLHHVLVPLLATRPLPPQAIDLARVWLKNKVGHASATQIWSALIKAASENPAVVRDATAWAETNLAHPSVYWMLAPLVKANRRGRRAYKVAVSWIRANPQHEMAYWLLNPMVVARRRSREVLQLALDWLDAFPKHPQAQHLFVPLLSSRPKNRAIHARVQNWLTHQQYHPKTANLVETLILRSEGAGRWMDYGERYIAATTDQAGAIVLGAMARAAKASPAYLDRMIDWIERETDPKLRRALQRGLGRALAEHMSNALAFLGDDFTGPRKRIATNALVAEVQRFTYIQPDSLSAIWNAPSGVGGMLLGALVASDTPGATLFAFLRSWLELHWRAPGYGHVVSALKRNPIRWQELVDSGPLSTRIVQDYAREYK